MGMCSTHGVWVHTHQHREDETRIKTHTQTQKLTSKLTPKLKNSHQNSHQNPHYLTLIFSVFQSVAGCGVLQCVAVCFSRYTLGVFISRSSSSCCSVLQCATECCSGLQCNAVGCSLLQCSVLQWVAVCSIHGMSLYLTLISRNPDALIFSDLQCWHYFSKCYRLLQVVAMCCIVLRCVAV